MKYLPKTDNGRKIRSLPVRGAWIEIAELRKAADDLESLPVRGAWIEIALFGLIFRVVRVAPRKGSVD